MTSKSLFFKHFFLISILFLSVACNDSNRNVTRSYNNLTIDAVILDSTLNIRALEIKNKLVYGASSTGKVYSFDASTPQQIKHEQYVVLGDSIIPNFRSLALTDQDVFALSIANPALLFKNGKVVYRESHPNVFYDSMEFWNNKEGIAVGDFTDNCISILITRDGGNTWKKLDCSVFPAIETGEGFFAASDSNIAIEGDYTWIASGGLHSRIYFSADKGRSWSIIKTPIIQGEPTNGIYSIDFYNKQTGYAIGGDYTKPKLDSLNKIRTSDGGKNLGSCG